MLLGKLSGIAPGDQGARRSSLDGVLMLAKGNREVADCGLFVLTAREFALCINTDYDECERNLHR
jgi:hypothetical protein